MVWAKLRAHSDDNLIVAEVMIPVSNKTENIAGKGENAVPAVSPFPAVFLKYLFCRIVKGRDCVVKGCYFSMILERNKYNYIIIDP